MSTNYSPSSSSEIFDRSRLLIDLDEATDPCSPPAMLVVVGFGGRDREVTAATESHVTALLSRLRDRFADAVGDAGTTYRTRQTELCAIIDGGFPISETVIESLAFELEADSSPAGASLAIGVVELPVEAPDAITALTIADRRMTAGPIADEAADAATSAA